MIFRISKASRNPITEIKEPLELITTEFSENFNLFDIDINTLEELMLLINQADQELIVRSDRIIIYDDYVE